MKDEKQPDKIETNNNNSRAPRVFDRVLVGGNETTDILKESGEKFTLENGYYVNETETIICRSTNERGKFFKKIHE